MTRAKVEKRIHTLRREDGAVLKIGQKLRVGTSTYSDERSFSPGRSSPGLLASVRLASRTPAQRNDRTAIRKRAWLATGIGALLGLKPFTPHDLRRTAATLAGDLGFDDA